MNEEQIRRVVRSEMNRLIIGYFTAGLTLGLLLGYIICIIEGLFK